MAIDLVSRTAWGARAPRGSYSTLTSTRGVKIHYTGGRVDPAIVDDHAKCVAMVKSFQNQHMNGNGWMDLGYSLVACPHRKVFVGRGPHRLPAANGPDLNSAHYAVLGLVGNSGLVVPPPGLLHGIRDAIDYLRAEGGAGREIKGHRDGYATSCPGEALYAWVKRGAPRPDGDTAPGPSTSWTEKLVKDLPMLRAGATGFDVKTIRALLVARGMSPTEMDLLNVEFTPELGECVKAFQRAEDLDADGIVGPKTWTALLRLA